MKIYIAGKIAGDRRYRAKFREAAKALEAAGHVVLNPATLPDGLTDADYMRICMAMVDAADLAVFWHTGNEPATLTACVFGVCGFENGVMGWIKTTKEKVRDRRWEQEDRERMRKEEQEAQNNG